MTELDYEQMKGIDYKIKEVIEWCEERRITSELTTLGMVQEKLRAVLEYNYNLENNKQDNTKHKKKPMTRLGRLRLQWRNSKAVVKQIENGEWEFRYNSIYGEYLTATRKGRNLWVGSSGFYCDVDGSNAFGYLFRHRVWRAVKKHIKQLEYMAIPDLTEE